MCNFFWNSTEYCSVQSITKPFQVYSGERSTKGGASDHRTFSELNFSNESTISSSTTFDKPPAKVCESPGPAELTFSELNYINTTPISSTPLRSQDSLNDVVWPTFLNFPTEFEDGVSPVLWRPPKSQNPYNVKPFLTDISVTVAQTQKIQKTRCIFLFSFW